jgi:hypothetical protein
VPTNWLCIGKDVNPTVNAATHIDLEREWLNVVYPIFVYLFSAVRYVDASNHFVLAECFPCIFVDSLGPCDDYMIGDGANLGWWATHHSDLRFENKPCFFLMILQTI